MNSRDFLLFRLAGPMAAYGGIAVGERRSIWGEPSKSAILGLIGAARGLVREAEADHQALEDGLGFAVRVDAPGRHLRDYHTAQAPRVRGNLSWRTRKEELADRGNLNTVLSERFYRLEARATVALWCKAGDIDLGALAGALKRPRFVLSLGRKSCPLGEPVHALVVAAKGLVAALDAYDAARLANDAEVPIFARRHEYTDLAERSVWFELDAGLTDEDVQANPIRQRRDSIRHRVLRQFDDRLEGRLIWRRDAGPKTDLLEGIVT